MLQMYGEKVEEAEELKLDIDDLKTMYRLKNCCFSVLKFCHVIKTLHDTPTFLSWLFMLKIIIAI